MRLGNILQQGGGIPETGRRVRFQIRQRDKRGAVSRKWCEAMIIPLCEDERAAAVAAARAYCADHADASPSAEEALQLAARFLVDPDQPVQKYVLAEQITVLRAGLIADQLLHLLAQYQEHIRNEYPELLPPSTKAELKAEIERLQKRLAALEEEALGESGPAPASPSA